MNLNISPKPLIELEADRFEPGYWQGMRQPAVQITLLLTRLEVATQAVRGFDALMAAVIAQPVLDSSQQLLDETVAQHPVLSRIVKLALAVLEKMGMPVLGGTRAVKPDPEGAPREWLVGLPAVAESIRAPQAALGLACRVMNRFAANVQFSNKALEAEITNLVNSYRLLAPSGVNTLRFLNAAHELGIPWRHVAKNVYQFGWGSRSRWLDSSFTDETSTISANLARDKVASATVLRNAGLPVPRHQLVNSAEQAVKVADALGYPVVVKPSDLDGGVGVLAGLPNADAVRKAFAVAAKVSKRILVEQFVQGSDHRFAVVGTDVFSVFRRRPARVIGDGARTVEALIAETNRTRSAQSQPQDPKIEQGNKPIVIDDEARDWLSWQGLDLSSVVASGVSVRLRGAANWSRGGTTQDVFSEAHPDNLDLAVRAAAALRLDIAGVDLLIPDISTSWKESCAAICEVNAQPQFTAAARHLQVLKRLVIGQGRIPVVLIFAREPGDGLPEIDFLRQRFGQTKGIAWCESPAECRQVLGSKRTELLVWMPHYGTTPTDALPFDRFDLVIEIGVVLEESLRSLLAQNADHWIFENTPLAFDELACRLDAWIADRFSATRQELCAGL